MTLRNVRPELHDRLKRRAAALGLSLNAYMLDLCRRAAEQPEEIDPWLPISKARSTTPALSEDART